LTLLFHGSTRFLAFWQSFSSFFRVMFFFSGTQNLGLTIFSGGSIGGAAPHLSLLIGALLWQRRPGAFVTVSSLSPVLPPTIDRLTGGTAEKRSKKKTKKRGKKVIFTNYLQKESGTTSRVRSAVDRTY